MKNMWDDRYGKIEFAYGEQPNNFLKNNLLKFLQVLYYFQQREGRNAIYAPHKAGMLMLLIKVSRVKESANTSEQT
jgi:hypothetical protein